MYPAVLNIDSSISYTGSNNRKTVYKCYPFKNNQFLLESGIKKGTSFSKKEEDRYILTDGKKITTMLGPVSSIDAYSKYLLYCYSLEKYLKKSVKYSNNILEQSFTETVFTIDQKGTIDIDDGVSISENGNIKIYISNVPKYLNDNEIFDIDRVSSLYFPNSRIPMISFSKDLSLLEGTIRDTVCLNLDTMTFSRETVKIGKNFTYEDNVPIIDKLNKKLGAKNSHESVEILMKIFNTEVAKFAKIYRNTLEGSYTLKKTEYAHSTSPIRRIVDIVNLTQLQVDIFEFKPELIEMCNKVVNNISDINKEYWNIRKVQNRVKMLDASLKFPDKIYKGVVVDIIDDKIFVKIDELNMTHWMRYSSKIELGTECYFKIYAFMKNFNQKVKLSLI